MAVHIDSDRNFVTSPHNCCTIAATNPSCHQHHIDDNHLLSFNPDYSCHTADAAANFDRNCNTITADRRINRALHQ